MARFPQSQTLPMLFVAIAMAVCVIVPEHVSAAGWAKYIGGAGYNNIKGMASTPDGGWIAVGDVEPYDTGETEGWILRFDSAGDVVWQKSLGLNGPQELLYSIRSTPDGGYIAVGHVWYSVGELDYWIVKLDSAGNVVWQRLYGGYGMEMAENARGTSDGGYIVVGYTEHYGEYGDCWVLKLDSFGNLVWEVSWGGASKDCAKDVLETVGGYIVAGWTFSVGAGGGRDGWLMKLDHNGHVVWERTVGGGGGDDAFESIQPTGDGGYVVAGSTSSFGAGYDDAWVVRFDAADNIWWQKSYGAADQDSGKCILPTSDGGYVLVGTLGYWWDSWFIKLDAAGVMLWQMAYGGAKGDEAWSVVEVPGSYVLGGYTNSFSSSGCHGFVVSVPSNGDWIPNCSGLYGYLPITETSTSAISMDWSLGVSQPPVGGRPGNAQVASIYMRVTEVCGGSVGPSISRISARTAKPGSTATVYGTGFSSTASKNTVYFGTKRAPISRARTTSLRVTIPRVKKGICDVYVVVNGQPSNKVQFLVK